MSSTQISLGNFVDELQRAGWRSTNDAQHEQIRVVFDKIATIILPNISAELKEAKAHVANCKVNAEYAWKNVRILEKARVAAEEQVKKLSSPMDLVRTVAIDPLELRVEEGYSFNGVQLPDELFNEIHAYVYEHKRPREFISAVIEMNMVKAINSCLYDIGILQAVIGYFHNETTFACYGSKEKMDIWLAVEIGRAK